MRKLSPLVLCLGITALAAPPALHGEEPPIGLDLVGGFWPDPQTVAVEVVGAQPASELVRGCPGFLGERAALAVTLERPSTPLRFYLQGPDLIALLVVDPDGIHRCAAVDEQGVAHIRLERALGGRFEVWAVVVERALVAEGRVLVSERDLGDHELGIAVAGAASALDPSAPPRAGRHRLPESGAAEVPLVVSGAFPAAEVAPACAGAIDPSGPDVVVTLDDLEPLVQLRVSSPIDTTLVVIGPDGGVSCDDDTYGLDPAVFLSGALPGDYAVWVGIYGGGSGEATLHLSRGGPGWPGEDDWAEVNPFLGRELQSAVQVLEILMTEVGLEEVLGFERLDDDRDGFTLHGVTLREPDGDGPPVRIARLRIAELDLEGLSARGEPRHFSLLAEGVDYAALALNARAEGLAPLPLPDGPATLSLGIDLLPLDGERSSSRLLMRLDGQFAVQFHAVLHEPDGGMANVASSRAIPFENALTELLELEFQDYGFLGAVLREQALEQGTTVEALVAEGLEGLRELVDPVEPGGLHAQLLEALSAALGDLERPGALRLRLQAREPLALEDLLAALLSDDRAAVDVEVRYAPLP